MGHRVDDAVECVLPSGNPDHMQDLADFFRRRGHMAFLRVDRLFDEAAVQAGCHEYPLFQMTYNDMHRSRFPLCEGHGRQSVLRTCYMPWIWQVRQQIQATLTEHQGEVRSWPTNRRDAWRPVESEYAGATMKLTTKELGHNFKQTMIEPSVFQRCAARGVGYDPIFTSRFRCVHERGCHPDLDRAISTLVVWDTNGQTMCIRQHSGLTLAEAFEALGSKVKYRTLYLEWLKGKLLFRASEHSTTQRRNTGRQQS